MAQIYKSKENLVEILKASGISEDQDDENVDFPIEVSNYYDDERFRDILKKHSTRMTIMSINVYSLRAKIDLLRIYIASISSSTNFPSILCIQETWIHKNTDLGLYQIPGYTLSAKPRTASERGGVAIYVHESLKFREITVAYNENIWECLCLEILTENNLDNITLLNVYRPPRDNSNVLSSFFEDLDSIIATLESKPSSIVVAGDFNLDLLSIRKKLACEQFFDILCSRNLLPKITLPTRITATSRTLIDNIFCSVNRIFNDITGGILTHAISDHQPIFIILNHSSNKINTTTKISYRNINEETIDQFKQKLSDDPIVLNEKATFEDFHKQFLDKFKEHFPTITKKRNKYNSKRSNWITPTIMNMLKKRDKMYFKLRKLSHKKDKYEELREELKVFNKTLKKNIKLAKRCYYSEQFNLFKNNVQKTWNTINNVLGRKNSKSSYPDYFTIELEKKEYDMTIVAEKMNKFFCEISSELSENIPIVSNKDPNYLLQEQQRTINDHFNFHEITEEDVLKAISNLQSKCSTGYDEISTKLLKLIGKEIAQNITITFNLSLKSCKFPDVMKIAKVIPLHKKGDNTQFNNYRPVSLLPAFSKIYERILHDQLYEYLERNQLLDEGQFGYRKNRSTDLAGSQLVNTILSNKYNGCKTVGLFLDLSKAFDCISHGILLNKLAFYGMNHAAISLLQDYLSRRTQYINLDGHCSSKLNITSGVPQGSILGPLLFLIYINDLPRINDNSNLSIVSYADDTNILYRIPKKQNTSDTETVLNNILENLNEWFCINRMTLNITKTNYIIFQGKRAKKTELNLKINNTSIKEVACFRFLGLMINKNLTWKDHIQTIGTKIARSIGILHRVKAIFPSRILTTLLHSLVISHMNNHILSWGQDNSTISSLQKRAIRAVFSASKYAHSTPLFKKGNVLKFNDIYRLNLLKFYLRFKEKSLPNYFLKNMKIKSNSSNHTTYRPTRGRMNIATPLTHSKSLDFQTCKFINALPDDIKRLAGKMNIRCLAKRYKNMVIDNYDPKCRIKECFSCKPRTVRTDT